MATRDYKQAYALAKFVIIAIPTNYDIAKNYFDTSSVESVIEQVIEINSKAIIVIKSTIPVAFTEKIQKKYKDKIIFFTIILRESKALYDNLYLSRIIVGCSEENRSEAQEFSNLLNETDKKRYICVAHGMY